MPLLVQRVQPVPAGTAACGCAAPPSPAAAAEEERADGTLFDDLVLGGGGDVVKNKADADGDASAEKLEWLRSQIIGAEAEFASPFGTRRITYADHTASGRCLRFAEEFVLRNVLPYYGSYTSYREQFLIIFFNKLLFRVLTRMRMVERAQGTRTRPTATWACTRASSPATRRGT